MAHNESLTSVTLINPNGPDLPPIAFKALTTLQLCYCVRPNMGFIKGGEKVIITCKYRSVDFSNVDHGIAETSPISGTGRS